MRERPTELAEQCRITTGRFGSTASAGNNGFFIVLGPLLQRLLCIVSQMEGWEHVSISLRNKKRLPTWEEMCFVKSLFWDDDEWVVQYHPAQSDYVNFSEALHLWRPLSAEMPTPPHWMVGPKTIDEGLDLMARFNGKTPPLTNTKGAK